jgi:hypothetical protein
MKTAGPRRVSDDSSVWRDAFPPGASALRLVARSVLSPTMTWCPDTERRDAEIAKATTHNGPVFRKLSEPGNDQQAAADGYQIFRQRDREVRQTRAGDDSVARLVPAKRSRNCADCAEHRGQRK